MALTIDELNIQIAADSKKATRALTSLIKKLEKLKDTLNGTNISNITISNSFNKVTQSVNKNTNAVNKNTTANTKAKKGFASVIENIANGNKPMQNFTDNLARQITKWRTLYGVFQDAANTMGEWFTESNDYIETLNLFNVTMGDGADAAHKYAKEVQDLIGIDMGEWMNYQGTFKQLTSGFGVASDKANIMSQNLTQLSYDLASFFNTDVETAFDKLSSAMSGQVKGLREFGIDTTVASLQEYALSKGIDASVRSMTQAEKSMLRYNYIMEKSILIQGDMARTLVTPSNALRVLSAQLTQMKRALGNVISVLVARFIPYVQAMVEIVTEAANTLANLLGFELPTIDYSGLDTGGFADDLEDAEDAVGGTADTLKKIKKQLMGFDELNIITNPDSGADSGASGGAGSGSGVLDMKPLEYNFLEGLKTEKLDEIKQKIYDILEIAKWVGVAIAGWKIGSFVANLATAGMEAKGLAESVKLIGKKLGIAAGITLAITGFALEFDGIKGAIKDGLDGIDFAKILGGATSLISGVALTAKMLGASAATILLSTAVSSIVAGAGMLFVGLWDAIKNGLDWLSGLLIPAGTTLMGAGIGALIGSVGGPLGALIGVVAGLVIDGIILLVQNWETVSAWFVSAFTAIGQFFINVWNGIVSVWNVVADWFNTWVITPIVNFFSILWTSVSGFFVNLWNDIVAIWNTVGEWFNTWVITPIVNFFVGLWTGISTAASNCWNAIVEFFTPAFEWFSALFSSIWQTISDIFYNIGVIANGCWEIIKAAWQIASTWFDESVIQPIKEFFQKLWKDISTFFSNLWEDIKEIWNKVATWFNTNVIQPTKQFFIDLWTGVKNAAVSAWEGIKNVFSTIGNWINTWIIQPVGTFFSNLWNGFKEGAKKAWEGVKTVFSTVGTFFKDTFTKAWNGIVKVFSIAGDIFVDIKDGIVSAFKLVVNGIIKGLNKVVSIPFSGINDTLRWLRDLEILNIQRFKNIRTISVPQIPLLASGGIVDAGQMFIAREAGPELVGSIGRKTAVANNEQIVSGIESGVYRAMMAANSGKGGDVTVYATFEMDGEVIGRKVIKYHNGIVMQTGESPLLV